MTFDSSPLTTALVILMMLLCSRKIIPEKNSPKKKIPKFFITVFLISLSDFKKPQFTPEQGFTDGVTDDYRPDRPSLAD